jgi:hypothetical protein
MATTSVPAATQKGMWTFQSAAIREAKYGASPPPMNRTNP